MKRKKYMHNSYSVLEAYHAVDVRILVHDAGPISSSSSSSSAAATPPSAASTAVYLAHRGRKKVEDIDGETNVWLLLELRSYDASFTGMEVCFESTQSVLQKSANEKKRKVTEKLLYRCAGGSETTHRGRRRGAKTVENSTNNV